ncbi:acyl-CoA dehydrogenase family protein [Nocardiopsis sp. FIRDI 009]|uniref:acyl-CoA dehydrogenase family protein n=1 Tax=Nocardiopsis sp. FIRDI 009 TaxID=714197 RepID=UPI000E26FF00|nr:acyl-CoA dehydrogenase family protein [Nocardiopsis sp. FIRDI 009]
MTVTGSPTERGGDTPAAPAPTHRDMVARAEALAPRLVEAQADTERRTHYSRETHEAFADAGFYRILVPRRFGGLEMGVRTFLEVSRTLARACPSTGWMYCLGATHALAVGTLFGERAQAEILAAGDFVCPATIVPGGEARRLPDGGWEIEGTWRYCSGSPYATHFMGHALVPGEDGAPPSPLLFVAPRDQWERLDDWGGQLGLRGSGSHGVALRAARVPDHWTLPVHMSEVSAADDLPGRKLHGPHYGGGPLSFMNLEIAALSVGMAQGALDAYEELMRSRVTLLPPIVGRGEDPDYQSWYGEAVGLIDTAGAAISDAVRQWEDLCEEGPEAFTREQDLRLATMCRQIILLSWRAVEGYLFPTAGSSAVRDGERIERVWRDLSTLHGHTGISVFLPTRAMRDLARVRFGAA